MQMLMVTHLEIQQRRLFVHIFSTDLLDNTDCDDADADENPNMTWYVDVDGDGFGDATVSNVCERQDPTDVLDGTDCDDTDSNIRV